MDFTLRGQSFSLTQENITAAMQGLAPQPIRRYRVTVAGRRYPPKQVLAHVTGLPPIAFTTQDAYRILERLGFVVQQEGN